MMKKKDYETVGKVIKEFTEGKPSLRGPLAIEFARAFSARYKGFDFHKFYLSCGLESSQRKKPGTTESRKNG